MGANGEIVKGVYAAFERGDVGAVLAVLDPNIEWREAEGVRYAAGNPFIGPQAVAAGVFMAIVGDVDDFAIVPGAIIDGGDMVAAEGRYSGTGKKTGAKLDAQFVHVFELSGGKIVRFRQHTDTLQWGRVVGE